MIRASLVGAILVCLNAGAVAAGSVGQKERHFVYDITADTAATYVNTFCPPAKGTIYLIAGRSSVLVPLETLIYYWPITKEFKPDPSGLHQPVQGTLEVLNRDDSSSQSISLQDYALEYAMTDEGGQEVSALHLGDMAQQRRAQFEKIWAAYPEESQRYQAAMREHAVKLRAGEAGPEDEPKAPEPIGFLVGPVRPGFVLSLLAGNYKIRTRSADGKVVPESEKNLVVFEKRREGIGYVAIPESKWTRPEVSDNPDDQLYAPDGTILYLQPFRGQEFNELHYSRLLNPQSLLGSSERWVWVHTEAMTAGKLVTLSQGGAAAEIERKDYYVRQQPDSGLGYEVLEWSEETLPLRIPTFSGYRVTIHRRQSQQRFSLLDTEGHSVEGSSRRMKSVDADSQFLLFLPTLIPLVFAAGLLVEAGQKKMRRGRREGPRSSPAASTKPAP